MTLTVDGLVLESKYADYNYCIKGPIETNYTDGFPRQQAKHIVLDFDSFLCEVDDVVARNELTDEDKEYIGRAVNAALGNPLFTEMWEHKSPKPNPPWPTYDDTNASEIPVVAKSIGLVREALTYETRGREPRPLVVKKLEGLLGESDTDAPVEDLEISAV